MASKSGRWGEQAGLPPAAPDRPSAVAHYDRLLHPGRNCWRIERAGRLAVIVDAARYFAAAKAAIRHARRAVMLIGWEFTMLDWLRTVRLRIFWLRTTSAVASGLLVAMLLGMPAAMAEPGRGVLAARASEALHRAVAFYRERVAVHGSYLWKYSPDLAVRRGEGEASPSQGWVQPPGTPAVGLAYLGAWEATGEGYLLDAALETRGRWS
jgi:hypothetical protein